MKVNCQAREGGGSATAFSYLVFPSTTVSAAAAAAGGRQMCKTGETVTQAGS